MTTLSDLRNAPIRRAEETYPLCVDLHLLAEYEQAQSDRDDLQVERALLVPSPDEDGDATTEAGPKKLVPRNQKRLREIDAGIKDAEARMDDLWERMQPNRKDLRLRAIIAHEWQALLDEHPARDPETPQGQRDRSTTFGLLDSDALIANLGRFAVAWGDEQVTPEVWDEVLYPRSTPHQLRQVASLVVALHEGEYTIPKSRPVSSTTDESETSSE